MSYPDILTIATQVLEIDHLRLQSEHWQREAEVWRNKAHLANADYADLRRDFEAAGRAICRKDAEMLRMLSQLRAVRADYDAINEKNSCLWIEVAKREQRIEELEAELGRSEDRRYEP